METGGALKVCGQDTELAYSGQDTKLAYSGQDEPPTSMNPIGPESFSQVTFTNIKPSYLPRTDIQCNFYKRKEFQSGSKDWVGIFKVGWQTTKEYYTWISLSSSAENEVLFKAYYLPKDDEYYQFCYVDQNGEVRGVSTPFQFREDDNEIVIVTTQEEMENITEENTKLKKQTQDQTEMIQTLQAQLQTATEKNNILEKENMKKNQDQTEMMQTLQAQLHTATEKNNTLEKENMKQTQDQTEMMQTLQAQLHTATEKNNILEKENMELQVQLKNLKEEIETMKRDNLEIKLQQIGLQDLETELKQKTMDWEKIEAKYKTLQSENEAKNQAIVNLTGLLKSCKEEVAQQKQKFEVQTSMLEKEKRLKEELQHSLENEKMKAMDLESNSKNNTTMLRTAEDSKIKLQQQLALQQKESATKDEEIKKLRLDGIRLEANVTKLNDTCKENLKKMENDKKINYNLEELNDRQTRKLLDLEDKIRGLETELRSTHERQFLMEQMLEKEQDENKKNKDHMAVLTNAVELREEEIRDLNTSFRKKREEVDELNQLIQVHFATEEPTSFFSPSQAPGLAFGNPYVGIPPRISSENESPERFETRQEAAHTPTLQKCPLCDEMFQNFTSQLFQDHFMCHDLEEN